MEHSDAVARFATHGADGIVIKRDQIWQRAYAAQARVEVRALLEKAEDPLRLAESEARALRSEKTFQAQLFAFWNIVEALSLHALSLQAPSLHAHAGGFDDRTLARMRRTALTILKEHGVGSTGSRLSFMHRELEAATGRFAERQGRAWSAAWHGELAGAGEVSEQLTRSLAGGHVREALATLLTAEMRDGDVTALRFVRARLLRLTGDLKGADQVLAKLPDSPEVRWERASVQCVRDRGLAPLGELIRRSRDNQIPRRMFELFLWSHATKSKQWNKLCPRVGTMRRKLKAAGDALSDEMIVCCRALERCHVTGLPLAKRLHDLGAALEQAENVVELDQQLLVWAAATRFLVRVRRPRMAALTKLKYVALCRSLTEGKNDDVFSLLEDVSVSAPAPALSALAKPEAAVPPQGMLRRHVWMAGMAREIMKRHWFGGSDGRAVELAEIAAQFMGHSKGPVMKLGQILSFYGFDVPADARDVLAELHDDAPALPFASVERVIETELGASVQDCFASFETHPIGVGSIGQVYRAALHDGSRVAVKVQYPNAREMIAADLRGLRVLAPLAKVALPHWKIDALLEELAARMLEECDYRREAASQRSLRALFEDRRDIVIPDVIDSLSTERVLTTRFFEGRRFDDFCATASATERRQASFRLAHFVVRTIVGANVFNTDMHPGNLLFGEDALCVVDFGSVRSWSNDSGRGWRWILRAVLDDDVALFRRAFLDLGMVSEPEGFDWQWAFDLLRDHALGLFTSHEMQQLDLADVRREVMIWVADHPDIRKVRVPPDYLYGFRVYWGFFGILARIGARMRWRRVLEPLLKSAEAMNIKPDFGNV